MNESDLVKEILEGNQQAVGVFYRRFGSKLKAFITKKVEEAAVEEVLQDTFVSALQSLPLFAAKSSLEVWLFGIAKHEIADYYRKKKIKEIVFSKVPFLGKLVSVALSPEIAYEEKELKEKIKRVLARLSEGKRQILRLRYIDGQTVSQIAQYLKISYKSAESRLSRARLAFRKEFVKENQGFYQNQFAVGST